MLKGRKNGADEFEFEMTPAAKFVSGVVATLLAAGVIANVLMFANQEVAGWRLERVESDVSDIKTDVEEIKERLP